MTYSVSYSESVPAGASWSARLRRGQGLRLRDVSGRANVSMILLRSDDPTERYNMPDTLKAQHIARLAAPCALYSDMGHVLASMVEDSTGWHDTVAGCSNSASVAARFGAGTYQRLRNERFTNARDHFLVELGKYGLGERDVPSCVNLFTSIAVGEDGALEWAPRGGPGRYVALRFEMDVLVALSATPHPLDPTPTWSPAGVELEVLRCPAPGADDPVRTSCEQNGRGFLLTERIFP